jgi:DNA adenine methylase
VIIILSEIEKVKKMNSPFRYPGGKFYARKLILNIIPKHSYYIEPLCGGASIFFAKPKVKKNWLNDIDEGLINCLLHIRNSPRELMSFLKDKKPSKENHDFIKNVFKPSSDLERAGRWFFLNRTSYSGIMKIENCFWGYGKQYSMSHTNWLKNIPIWSRKLQKVKLTPFDFEEIIKNSPKDSFLFIDPPYFNSEQDKFYTHTFSKKDHIRLARSLKKHSDRIKFLLTYDDSEEIRELYDWAKVIQNKSWTYMINRTDDQKNGTKTKGTRKKGKEIFIMNYIPKAPLKEFL